jgi:hypothetical protein
MVRVLACLAEGVGLRGTVRVFEVDSHTVLHWCNEAAAPLQACSRSFLGAVPGRQVHLDEWSAVFSGVQDGTVSETQAMRSPSASSQWVWTALDPESP